MEIEARDHRHVRAHRLPHPPQQLPVRIVEVLGDHGAVQVEVDGVEAAAAAEILEQHRRNPLERIARHRAGRLGGTPAERQQLVVQAARLVDETGHRQVDAADRVEERGAAGQAGPGIGRLEVGIRRRHLRERVRLVLDAAHRDPGHGCV